MLLVFADHSGTQDSGSLICLAWRDLAVPRRHTTHTRSGGLHGRSRPGCSDHAGQARSVLRCSDNLAMQFALLVSVRHNCCASLFWGRELWNGSARRMLCQLQFLVDFVVLSGSDGGRPWRTYRASFNVPTNGDCANATMSSVCSDGIGGVRCQSDGTGWFGPRPACRALAIVCIACTDFPG